MNRITFAQPAFLWLLILVPAVVAYWIWQQQKNSPSLRMPVIMAFGDVPKTFRHYLRHIVIGLRALAIGLLIVALARPQSSDEFQNVTTEGIDIVMAMDISSSMLARDFNPDRLEASKAVATEFISNRQYDRVGLVAFSAESFTQCPLTTDHAVLINLMRELKSGMLEDGTAIGNGLATAVNRIKDSESESKVIILLTDGVNNRGEISPQTAAEIAKTFGIKVYTIGVGTMGTAPYPVQTIGGQIRYMDMLVEIDEDVLREIASTTGGKYFRATDNSSLKEIYSEIDEMEKSVIDVQQYVTKEERFLPFVLWAVILIFVEILCRILFLRSA